MNIRVIGMAAAMLLALPATAARAAEDSPISAFLGVYEGQSISTEGEGLSARDLSVKISPRRGGFNLSWTTVTHRADKDISRKDYSIDFIPSPRKGIYSSAMREDMFGSRRPIDPLAKGDPFVWATIQGKTLVVHALLITDDGGYELQTYERTLTAEGLSLKFTRFRDGERLKLITGLLAKKKK